MFSKNIYVQRRKILKNEIGSGIILMLGNEESPMNYTDNTYHFRQDSTFLYYFGLDQPNLAAMIDIDEEAELIFGNELSVEEIVWMGVQKTLTEKAELSGIGTVIPIDILHEYLTDAIRRGRQIHIIPQYRAENLIKLGDLLGIRTSHINKYISAKLIKAVINQRIIKSKEEIEEIEKAISVSYDMYIAAMKSTKEGLYEREVAGLIEGIALSKGNGLSFPTIFSVNGEILHNHNHDNLMKNGSLVVLDSGVETERHYASDITRAFPVSGKFTDKQKEIYNIVLEANLSGINAVKPGINFREVHLLAAKIIASGLKKLGFFNGEVDDIVHTGAYALFFPHGLGHLLGLDVHDMENYGEQNTGYDESITRSELFGLGYLRFAKELKPGHIMTIEPGIYFMPQLIDKWESENKFTKYINYDKAKSYVGFGGIRIEDDVLVTETSSRVLGKPIPKSIKEIEAIMSSN
jgi:Xaa-Pro aminopeptidase